MPGRRECRRKCLRIAARLVQIRTSAFHLFRPILTLNGAVSMISTLCTSRLFHHRTMAHGLCANSSKHTYPHNAGLLFSTLFSTFFFTRCHQQLFNWTKRQQWRMCFDFHPQLSFTAQSPSWFELQPPVTPDSRRTVSLHHVVLNVFQMTNC